MVDPLSLAIAAGLASYDMQAAHQAPTVKVEVSSTPKRGKRAVKANDATGAVVAAVKVPGPKSDPLPPKGTIDAEGFLRQLPSCGKRLNNHGVLVFQGALQQRDDEKRLIAAFVGYDSVGLHGTQLDNARRLAKLNLAPVKGAEHRRGFAPIVNGYVAGMPDAMQARIDDLLARERLAASNISDYEKKVSAARSGAERDLFNGMMQLEEGRLGAIRRDLAALGSLTLEEAEKLFPVDDDG